MHAANAIFGNPERAKLTLAIKSPILLPHVNTDNPINESLTLAITPNADKIPTTSAAHAEIMHIEPKNVPKSANN